MCLASRLCVSTTASASLITSACVGCLHQVPALIGRLPGACSLALVRLGAARLALLPVPAPLTMRHVSGCVSSVLPDPLRGTTRGTGEEGSVRTPRPGPRLIGNGGTKDHG